MKHAGTIWVGSFMYDYTVDQVQVWGVGQTYILDVTMGSVDHALP